MKKFVRKILMTMAVLLVGGIFASPARGQFIGYTSPQSEQSILAPAGTACTGTPQRFTAPNLGQNQHYVSLFAASAITYLQMEIDGVDSFGISYRLSEVADMAQGQGAALSAAGYYPQVVVKVTCLPASTGTFGITYSGTSSTSNISSGAYQTAQIDKVVFNGISGSGTNTDSFQAPFGNSYGTIVYAPSGSPSSASLNVTCAGASGIAMPGFIFTTAASSATQYFFVPSSACPQVGVSLGAVGAITYRLEYIFSQPGFLNSGAADPCQSPQVAKSSAVINVSTATATQLVPASGATAIYVCGVSMSIAPSATTADTATFEYGTGASCGTGTAALTGAFGAGDLTTSAPPLFVTFADPGTTIKTPVGNALCVASAGTTVNIQGVLTYVQQ